MQFQQIWLLHVLHYMCWHPAFFSIPWPQFGHFLIPSFLRLSSLKMRLSFHSLHVIPLCDYLHFKQYHLPHRSQSKQPDFLESAIMNRFSQFPLKQWWNLSVHFSMNLETLISQSLLNSSSVRTVRISWILIFLPHSSGQESSSFETWFLDSRM